MRRAKIQCIRNFLNAALIPSETVTSASQERKASPQM